MLDWHSCQICYPLEIKLLLFIIITTEVLCNKNKKGSFDRTISQFYYFATACNSNHFIISACLLDMVLRSFFLCVIHYENKMVDACRSGVC